MREHKGKITHECSWCTTGGKQMLHVNGEYFCCEACRQAMENKKEMHGIIVKYGSKLVTVRSGNESTRTKV
jgi:hypothetical protein